MGLVSCARSVTSSLRARVLILTVLLFAAFAAPAAVAFDHIVSRLIERLGGLIAEKQILYDRTRGLEALLREASLAETLTRSPTLRAWALDETNPEKRTAALAELERYRQTFKDRSYFVVLDGSGNYYFNDRLGTYRGRELRYAVSADNPRDGWYFKTRRQPSTCQLNVDHDDNLAVTKVWINCVVRDGRRVLGIVGSGIELADFIREVVAVPQTGVESIFVDPDGAIQAHRDPQLVDFHSLTKDTKSKKTIFGLVDSDKDRTTLLNLMNAVAGRDGGIATGFVRIGGRAVLAGVGYLDEIGWYTVTLMDLDALVDRRLFLPLGILLAVMLAGLVLVVTLVVQHIVLDRLARLEMWAGRVAEGDHALPPLDPSDDEIGRLTDAFDRMARAIGRQTEELEAKVRERTRQLEEAANRDPLTGVLNRRGFLAAYGRRAADPCVGLLLVDLDMLKEVNDTHGHAAGDTVIVACATRIAGAIGPADVCGRWGGDEFVVLVADGDRTRLCALACRIRAAVAGSPVEIGHGRTVVPSVSIGGDVADPSTSIDDMTRRVDEALYASKRAGRGRIVLATGDATAAPAGA